MTTNQALQQFRRAGYATTRRIGTIAERRWIHVCADERRPFVVVREKQRYANVEVSLNHAARLWPQDPQCSEAAGQWFAVTARDALTRGRRDAVAIHSEGPATWLSVHHIPIADAHAIARGLIAWFSSPVGWQYTRNPHMTTTPDPIPFGWVNDLDDPLAIPMHISGGIR